VCVSIVSEDDACAMHMLNIKMEIYLLDGGLGAVICSASVSLASALASSTMLINPLSLSALNRHLL
jgi:hypothetical protein